VARIVAAPTKLAVAQMPWPLDQSAIANTPPSAINTAPAPHTSAIGAGANLALPPTEATNGNANEQSLTAGGIPTSTPSRCASTSVH
jgi:hypothetical protein